MTVFYLGTHMPHWLTKTDVPLFVSRTRLEVRGSPGVLRKHLPRAKGHWALDSGGFTQLHKYGGWALPAKTYAAEVRRCAEEIGNLDWAAPMDWMCEPSARAMTGLSVGTHQQRTINNFLELRTLAPDLPILPVLQGWERSDYEHCIDLYDRAGVDLTRERFVGLGSVCRRQATKEIGAITSLLHNRGLRLHGFGIKTRGLAAYAPTLASADSLSWSYRGRRVRPCTHGRAMHEGNCMEFAMQWRRRVLEVIGSAEMMVAS